MSGDLGWDDGWAISPDTAAFLRNHIQRHQPREIIESGSGYSTLLFASAGSQVTSLEHDPSYAAATRKRLDLHGLEARVILAPLVGDPPTYSTSDLDATAQFDLAFLDGPPGRIGRGPVLPALAPYLKPGAFIVLDDAKRDSEQAVWRSWCGSLPLVDAKLVDTDRGLAIAIWGP